MARVIILVAALLTGCAPAARDIRLDDVNFADMAAVQEIRDRLSPEEGVAFADFVARHRIGSASFCGQPLIDNRGREPATIGDAVDLALRRDAAERQAAIEAKQPKHPLQLAKGEWDRLIFARDVAIDAQSRLRMEYGERAERQPEWRSLQIRIAEIDQKLAKMKAKVFGG